jgi:MFS family permease
MGLGYPAITSQLLLRIDADVVLTPEQVSWFASITAIVCPLGGPLSGFFTDKIGRRNSMMLLSIISMISWIVVGFSSRVDSQAFFVQLMIGRALIGIGIGMTTAPTVMYVSEVCHPKLRGRLTLLSSPFFTAFGLLTIYFLGYLIPVSRHIHFESDRESFTHLYSSLDRLQTREFYCRRDYGRHASHFNRTARIARSFGYQK